MKYIILNIFSFNNILPQVKKIGANAKRVVLLHAMGNGVEKDLPNLIMKEIFDASNNEFSMVLFLLEELLLLCMRKKGVEFPVVVEYRESKSAILGSTVGKNIRQAAITIDEDEGGDVGVQVQGRAYRARLIREVVIRSNNST